MEIKEQSTLMPMNNSPKVTIVTVVYNDAAHLERTMRSVLDQTYKNIEYVIIDGGSTDGTVAVIKKYADRLAYWVSEKDKGIYDAMNKGISRATGTWLNFMNSGDYFVSNNVFEKIFSADHAQSDLLYGSFIGNFSGQKVACVAFDSVPDRAWQGMPLSQQALFTRTELMKKNPFDTSFKVSADGNFVAQCVVAKRVFERLDMMIFEVGTMGYSHDNWLRARRENWRIARTYFPSLRTDWYHGSHLAREVVFRVFKKLASYIGLYQLLRYVYRKTLRSRVPLLPKNVSLYKE